MDSIHKVETMLVAGMNYRITVSLKSTCIIPGGPWVSNIRCERVEVHKPLPVYCISPNPDNPKCMIFLKLRTDSETDVSKKCSTEGGGRNVQTPGMTDIRLMRGQRPFINPFKQEYPSENWALGVGEAIKQSKMKHYFSKN